MSGRGALVARTVAVDDSRDLLPLLPDPAGVVWLRRGEGFVAWGEAARLPVGCGPARFQQAAQALAALFERSLVGDDVDLPGSGPIAFGSFTFDPAVAGSSLLVPRFVLGRRDRRSWLTVVGDAAMPRLPLPQPPRAPAPERIRYAGASVPDLRWLEAVAAAVELIDDGQLAKVVLARDHGVWAEAPLDARALAARLAPRFPECFTFAVDGLVGATPELLVGRFGREVESVVLAGSAARGANAAEDARLGEHLLASGKDRAEHRLSVDSVIAGLEPLCGRLSAQPEPSLLGLANVQHLATTVRGELGPGRPATALELAGALHPTAAVCGSPRNEALQVIRALESMCRGRYAGPVGWVDARGDGEWCLALRCAELSGARARLFAGAGIVAGSLPEAELEETRLKLRAMQSALHA